MIGLTRRQQECLSFVERQIQTQGYPPTQREIGDAMGIRSTNGVNDHLMALERKGSIRRTDYKSRAIVLTSLAALAREPSKEAWTHWDPTPGTLLRRKRCLLCLAVTFAASCPVCRKEILEVMP